ncbi:MAG: hypothetical protein M1550_02885 [Deltaproteobacteria bacterium]|nr:hypothetical protein [Deltaproteobacteria bacterium]
MRRDFLAGLRRNFASPARVTASGHGVRSDRIERQLARLFGRETAAEELGSPEFVEKLAGALNAVFEALNGIIGTINATLLGRKPETETIRHLIGSSIEEGTGTQSIEEHLARIQSAFLVAHRAFQEAARAKFGQLLAELDPDLLEARAEGGLKFGPLRKAELFEIYKEKYRECHGWFASGRFTQDLLREFEKTCQKLYSTERKGRP